MAQKNVLGKGLASLLPKTPPAPPVQSETSEQIAIPEEVASPTLDLSTGDGAIAAGAPSFVIPTSSEKETTDNKDRLPGISFADPHQISENPYQPRRDFDDSALEDLTKSIIENGLIQPLIVRKEKSGYQLIAGERRLRAAKKAGLTQVPIVIRRSTDKEALELALVENIQRQDLNCIDEALAYFQLIQDFTLTQDEVAKRVGKDRASVANHLRLLKLPEQIVNDLRKQELSFGHGKALLGIEDNAVRLKLREKIIKEGLSVRETENEVNEIKSKLEGESSDPAGKDGAEEATPVTTRLKNLSQDLTRHWFTKVEIKGSDKRGKIVFHFKSREDLERLLATLQKVY